MTAGNDDVATYDMAAFVGDLRRLVAQHDDIGVLLGELAPLAKRLAVAPGWVRPEMYEVDESQGIGIVVLHEEADHTLLVETVSWAPGLGVLPHDHQTWGVVAGIDGDERNVLWKRLDDAGRPGYAELEVEREVVMGPGDLATFRGHEIHSVRNDGERTSLSLHVYGKSLHHVERSEFVPGQNIVRPCPQRAKRPLGRATRP
jgi:predicted metal-dependent enzyme (double-stranded beta helix superfamily)